jgi:hypothetical protein
LQPIQQHSNATVLLVIPKTAAGIGHHGCFVMVLQIFADTWQINGDLDSVLAQQVRRPKPRQHHKLWR